eukprot:11689132-Ditylum_brightwellii.AAC.1
MNVNAMYAPSLKKRTETKARSKISLHMKMGIFKSGANIIDAASRKLWTFLTSTKRPPICIIRFSIHALAREGKVVRFIIIDEEGSLA